MDKIKRRGDKLSLRKSLALYVLFFVLLALLLSAVTAYFCDNAVNAIWNSYESTGEKYYLTNQQGEQLGEGAIIGVGVAYTEKDERTIALLEFLPVAAAFLYSGLCLLCAVLLFYQRRLKKPLTQLQTAADKIANNELDFSLQWDTNDELGRLCASFAYMRATLEKNFSDMWRQVEERKQLNASFAHDLRTPLTVIKGYNELLGASENSATRQTSTTMGKHIARMEAYITSMSHLQRLEDVQPQMQISDLGAFIPALCEGAELLCRKNGKTMELQNQVTSSHANMDKEFVSQVFDNLLSNALRYAKSRVFLSFGEENGFLRLSIKDDGTGFQGDSLQKATTPYYTAEKRHGEHFGLGLYIAKLLCERHGGYLQTENIKKGAKVTAFFKISSL